MRLGREFERLWPGTMAVALAAVIWAVLAIVSHGVDRPPIIKRIEVQPPTVPSGGTALVRVHAEDPDGGPLRYEFAAESGSFHLPQPSRPQEAQYIPAPGVSAVVRITVTVTDSAGLVCSGSSIVTTAGAVATAAREGEPAPEAAAPPVEASAERAEAPPTPRLAVKHVNHPPALNGGGRIYELRDNVAVLEITGMDPDGDRISFAWDFGTCLLSEKVEIYRAEVRLRPGCDNAAATLTWTDTSRASATVGWQIQR